MLRITREDLRDRYALVLGGGKFGTIAARYLVDAGAEVTVVDRDPNCEASRLTASRAVNFVCRDALSFFEQSIKDRTPFIVVTAITKHFAGIYAEKLLQKGHRVFHDISCLEEQFTKVTEEIDYGVFEEYGIATASYMPFGMVCPDDCYPGKLCTVTGKARGRPMYEILADVMGVLDLAVVLPSYQLGRGVGGVMGEDLIRMRDQFEHFDEGNCGVATACLCHGVINAFRVERRGKEVS
ncbi:MAG: hypothetical protein SCAL_000679 [Candidatus Syntrophoarchaeum caldarius]|uniref:Uncharacterized protein n=1 Tax=Candidatus Syntropharchaeum caldarium TaxID=1838285 RepID=A0A1F2P9H6_9EURY|nr:MAG: hypothetical protein SCAL_000679 [Candidatus Syntrophoarchaeum caldarius]